MGARSGMSVDPHERALELLSASDEQGLPTDELIARSIAELYSLAKLYQFNFEAILNRAGELTTEDPDAE